MEAASVAAPEGLGRTRGRGDRIGDTVLYVVTACAAVIGVAIVFAIVWRIAEGAWPAIKVFHTSFLWHNEWNDDVTAVLPFVMSQGTSRRLNNVNTALLGIGEHDAINSGDIDAFGQAAGVCHERTLVNHKLT